jgi:hypothetical protein
MKCCEDGCNLTLYSSHCNKTSRLIHQATWILLSCLSSICRSSSWCALDKMDACNFGNIPSRPASVRCHVHDSGSLTRPLIYSGYVQWQPEYSALLLTVNDVTWLVKGAETRSWKDNMSEQPRSVEYLNSSHSVCHVSELEGFSGPKRALKFWTAKQPMRTPLIEISSEGW